MKKFMLAKHSVFFRTILSLSFSQIFYRLLYIFKRKILIALKVKPIYLKKINQNLYLSANKKFNPIITNQYSGDIDKLYSNEFFFCNKKIVFKKEIDWNKACMNKGTRLFKLNLHYQDYLLDASLNFLKNKKPFQKNFIIDTIKSWVSRNNFFDSESFKCNWNSYCVSLRLMNYIKVFCLLNSYLSVYEKRFLTSIIYQHSNFLKKNLENDIKGNHLLENIIALLFSFIFLNFKKDFDKYFVKISKVLNKQILDDGAHYELSSMYHGVVYLRILELVDFSASNNLLESNQHDHFKKILSKMLNWSLLIQLQNTTPLLNDSFLSKTLNIDIMLCSFKNVFKYDYQINKSLKLSKSGYRKFQTKNYEMLIDIGQIGAREVPGHAHADTFNTIIYDNNGPLFIDPGVSTYNNNATRYNERSSSFHNTTTFDYKNSSEIWSSFRVGKQCEVDIIFDSSNFVHAKHNGYSLYGHVFNRKWIIKDKQIIVEDIIETTKNNSFYQHWILAPDKSFELKDTTIKIDDVIISFSSKNLKIIADEVLIAKDFNLQVKTTRFSVEFYEKLSTRIDFT